MSNVTVAELTATNLVIVAGKGGVGKTTTAINLATALAAAGYVVDSQANGEEAWFLGDTESYAAAILDLGLPGMDGLTVLKRWRAAGRDFPVLVLTARGAWTERVEGIDAGADDYLPNPSAWRNWWPGCAPSSAARAVRPIRWSPSATPSSTQGRCG